MPIVPTIDGPQVRPGALPNARMDTSVANPAQAQEPFRDLQRFGQAQQAASESSARIAIDIQERANQVRVDDAINQAKERRMAHQFDNDTGFMRIVGRDALDRESGKALADEFQEMYETDLGAIADSLGNPRQRDAFTKWAGNDIMEFRRQALTHEATQQLEYEASVHRGTIRNRQQEVALSYNNPEIVSEGIRSIKAAQYQLGQAQGLSASEIESQQLQATSAAHEQAVDQMMASGQVLLASQYMQQHGKDMTAQALAANNAAITKELDGVYAKHYANTVMGQATPRIEAPEIDQIFNVVLDTESAGRQFADDGSPLTSSAGAVGIAQVMPTTAPEAAKLAGLEWDEEKYRNDEEYNKKLGRAYFEKQIRDFGGNVNYAMAAYNAGPGATRKAIAKAKQEGTDWLEELPQETQDYVVKNNEKIQQGMGKPEAPLLDDLLQNLEAEMENEPNPARRKLAREELTRMFEFQMKVKKQKDERQLAQAHQAILDNGGDYWGLPISVRKDIPAEKVDDLIKYAKVVSRGGSTEIATDWGTYYDLRNDPRRLAEADLMAYRNQLADSEFKKLTDVQQSLRKSPGKQTQLMSDLSMFKMAWEGAGLGKPDNDERRQQYARATAMYEDRVDSLQETTGRKPTPDEKRQIIDEMFTEVTRSGSIFWGAVRADGFAADRPLAVLAEDEIPEVVVPNGVQEQIRAKAQERGLNLNDQQVREMYVQALRMGVTF